MNTTSQERTVCSPRDWHPLIASLFIIGLALAITMTPLQTQEPRYVVKDIGTLPGLKTSQPTALNGQGEVTGTATAGGFDNTFLYFNGAEKDQLEQLGDLGSRGFGIDPGGIVAGDSFVTTPFGPVSHAVLFKGSAVVDLGVLVGQVYSRANAINAIGQVVGFSGPSRDSQESRAFIWTDPTSMIDIGTLGGPYAQATAVNDTGWVTGTSEVADAIVPETTHAFIYRPLSRTEQFTAPMQDLGTLGGNSSYGTSINANNHVAGYSTVENTSDRVHAFFYDGKGLVDLGALATEGLGEESAALALNNNDQVVGVSYSPNGARNQLNGTAFIWSQNQDQGQMINLNALIGPAAKTLWLLSAVAINNDGEIAAAAYDYGNNTMRAVLLTPLK